MCFRWQSRGSGDDAGGWSEQSNLDCSTKARRGLWGRTGPPLRKPWNLLSQLHPEHSAAQQHLMKVSRTLKTYFVHLQASKSTRRRHGAESWKQWDSKLHTHMTLLTFQYCRALSHKRCYMYSIVCSASLWQKSIAKTCKFILLIDGLYFTFDIRAKNTEGATFTN